MGHDTLTDELREQAALYAMGMLEAAEVRQFESHLRDGCALCEAEVREMRETQAELAFAAVRPAPPRLRRNLLEQSRPLPSGVSATRGNEGKWLRTPYPGVTMKPVYRHPVTGEVTQLVRFEPGAKLPPHQHTADEQCLVVEGDIRMGNTVFRAGDFTWAKKDSQHHVLTSEEGCLLLIVASPEDEYGVLEAV